MGNVYAQPGKPIQQIGGTCPPGWVQMVSERPSPHHTAQADGTWRDGGRDAAKRAIDVAAGEARAAFVSAGWGVEEEYRLAKTEAQAWTAAGRPADAVPPTVAVWAQAKGWTPEQAAQDIEQTEQAWMDVLAAIRQQRLLGKAAVDAADDAADFMAIAQPFIDALNAIRPPA